MHVKVAAFLGLHFATIQPALACQRPQAQQGRITFWGKRNVTGTDTYIQRSNVSANSFLAD